MRSVRKDHEIISSPVIAIFWSSSLSRAGRKHGVALPLGDLILFHYLCVRAAAERLWAKERLGWDCELRLLSKSQQSPSWELFFQRSAYSILTTSGNAERLKAGKNCGCGGARLRPPAAVHSVRAVRSDEAEGHRKSVERG